ncbi:MAG: hypothetical protein R2784_19435 [Saprospiraceae bacterium]
MAQLEQFSYDNKIVRNFGLAAAVFGIIGMLVGLWMALELVFPSLNLGLPWTTFASPSNQRKGVIFCGNIIIFKGLKG